MLQPDDVAHVVAMLATQEKRSFASEVILRPTQKPERNRLAFCTRNSGDLSAFRQHYWQRLF